MNNPLNKLKNKMFEVKVVDKLQKDQRSISFEELWEKAKAARKTFKDEDLARFEPDYTTK